MQAVFSKETTLNNENILRNLPFFVSYSELKSLGDVLLFCFFFTLNPSVSDEEKSRRTKTLVAFSMVSRILTHFFLLTAIYSIIDKLIKPSSSLKEVLTSLGLLSCHADSAH